MSIFSNRFYLICGLILIFYFSMTIHEISYIHTGHQEKFERIKWTRDETLKRGISVKISNKQYCRLPRVAITVLSDTNVLQLYWNIEYIQSNDWIGLFQENPLEGKTVFPIYAINVLNSTGTAITNILSPSKMTIKLSFKEECYPFWAVYFTDNETASAVSCLKTNPTWMYDIRGKLNNIPLRRVFLPGTHNSGSYLTSLHVSALNVIKSYIFTQDEDVLSQLIHGIRFLDLRVTSYPNLSDRWWINHGKIRVQPLKNILVDIKTFLRNTREIIILDFHEFPEGFKNEPETHKDLVSYLRSELSEWTAPPNWDATCGELWNSNKTLVISYNEESIVNEFPSVLWKPVIQKWANVQTINKLKDYFNEVILSRPTYSWSAMAELTPTLWSIITHKTNSLQNMANEVNPHVTNWFRGNWGRTCNIVAVDFFRGSDIVNTAIEWNIRRTRKHICDIL